MVNEDVLYGTKEILTEKQKFTLNYYITKAQRDNKIIYGISIKKLHNERILEKEAVTNISDRYNTVREIINMLIEHAVTPVSMVNILDDVTEDVDDTGILSRAC
ncbi:MAG TPA: hypothetical protein DCP90_06165 [Clostridiales bacterium]|nr:MAG: hypothetical protein A2Y22_09135 [Clostridiales bacterium GWD2_32_59]HAN10179.1 hypothetical protein [Clostridiales bacterium]